MRGLRSPAGTTAPIPVLAIKSSLPEAILPCATRLEIDACDEMTRSAVSPPATRPVMAHRAVANDDLVPGAVLEVAEDLLEHRLHRGGREQVNLLGARRSCSERDEDCGKGCKHFALHFSSPDQNKKGMPVCCSSARQ